MNQIVTTPAVVGDKPLARVMRQSTPFAPAQLFHEGIHFENDGCKFGEPCKDITETPKGIAWLDKQQKEST